MNFEGEHLLPGQTGHFLIILSCIASLISAVSFFLSAEKNDLSTASWKKTGRIWFFIHMFSLIAVFGIVVYICSNHYYEYMYVYKHTSKELEFKYLLACIWEGQEGSFLLWLLWQGLLGCVLIFRAGDWESPVMGVISTSQLFISLMILGIYFFDVRIGNSLFTLTRNEIAAPIFSRPDYLNFIKDGVGLNVLLRNYWMVIHPPVLFLGFSSAIIPFAYAFAGLWQKKYGDWVKPVLPWMLFSSAVLGVGIMMGGKWAYESLSFGGYWAWDPVENASLVPWLILIAGLHTLVIFKSTGRSLGGSFLFSLLGYSFVLYSTFLTRTGILGETSVHSFTEAGAAINIMIGMWVAVFAFLPLTLLLLRRKEIPVVHSEEATSSREFWMFMGSLVIFLSSLFIIIITSIPVFNKTPLISSLIEKLHGGPLAMPEDPEFLYNKVMVMVAIILGVITGFAQYLKYKQTAGSYRNRKLLLPLIISLAAAAAILYFYPISYYKHGQGFLIAIYLAFAAMLFSLIGNGAYILTVLKGKLRFAGASIAHAGFALMILGMLVSSGNKKVISDSSVNGITLGAGTDPMTKKSDDPRENLTLIRDVPARMGDYSVTYTGDSSGHEKGRKFFSLNFQGKDKSEKDFTLLPDVYLMKDNNMSSNPDIRSFLTHDIFTYVSFATKDEPREDTAQFRIEEMKAGDTAFYNNGIIVLNSVMKNPSEGGFNFKENDAALVADISVISRDSLRYRAFPYIQVDSLGIIQQDDTVFAQNIYLRFAGVADMSHIKIGIKESDRLIDFVTVKTYIFPYVNLVWLGLIIMAMGLVMSMAQRAGWSGLKLSILYVLVIAGLIYMFLIANN